MCLSDTHTVLNNKIAYFFLDDRFSYWSTLRQFLFFPFTVFFKTVFLPILEVFEHIHLFLKFLFQSFQFVFLNTTVYISYGNVTKSQEKSKYPGY